MNQALNHRQYKICWYTSDKVGFIEKTYWPSNGQEIACMPIFGHKSFGHN